MTTTRSPRPPSGPPQPPTYNWKATLWLVVGVLVVIGAMGVFMRVIPTPFTQPAPTTVPTQRPPSQPAVTPQPTATNAPAPTSAPTPLVITIGAATPTAGQETQPAGGAPASEPTPLPTTAIQVQPTAATVTAPTVPPTPELSSQATSAPAIDPALQAEVLDAYSRYWQIEAEALLNLDSSNLDQVMYGQELLATEAYIEQLRGQAKAGRTDVEHSIQLIEATPDEAEILDRLIDRSVFVDPTTKEPLPPEQQASKPQAEVPTTYYLRKIDGIWKVTNEE
jgi:hypothetical protein